MNPPEKSKILNLMGDVVLGEVFENYKSGIGSRILKENFDPFLQVRSELNKGDLNIINLESVISGRSSRKFPWSEIMRGDPSFVKLLINNRIHAVNLANNHSLDHGKTAFDEMTKYLDESGIVHFGGPRDYFQETPAQILIDDLKILILGYYIEESLIESKRNDLFKRIIKTISRVKSESNLLILSIHWGNEYSDKPLSWILQKGKELIDSGVDILYGHHSHTYQGVSYYKGKIFAPSLGNFVFEDWFKKNRLSALLQVELLQTEFSFRTYPIIIDKTGTPKFYSKLKNRIESLNENLSKALCKSTADLTGWDMTAMQQVKSGHIKNRIKIRLRSMAHPLRYFPFIISRNGH